ncbi:MAG: hypothetical protein IJN23_07360 [Akkermansia sp.]|nr:hypothetical protein [Akkermansia sp.]
MGIFQDNFSSLSELERLAAMAHDPVRVHEIGADQWPLAMMACALMASNDEEKQKENLDIYRIFAEKTTPAARKASLVQFTRFISGRKGEGWKALLPYATEEPDAALSRKAALCMATLAQPGPEEKLAGVQCLVEQLRSNEDAPITLLEAVLSMADMRVLPLLKPLELLSEERLADMLEELTLAANRPACTWVLTLLSLYPGLAEQATAALCRMGAAAPYVLDVVMPVPTWAFAKPDVQPLHGWTRPEYFARMLSELSPILTPEQLERVRAAFS